MLHIINSVTHPLLEFVKDDPVRPEIPPEFRVSDGRVIYALGEDNKPQAMVCVSFHNYVPSAVDELHYTVEVPTVCVAYTIWSYSAGAGRELLQAAMSVIKTNYPSVTTFVTLSPKTEMARRFHLKNGAIVLRENETTVNYEYVPK